MRGTRTAGFGRLMVLSMMSLALTACASHAVMDRVAMQSVPASPPVAQAEPAPAPAPAADRPPQAVEKVERPNRLIIYTGQIHLVVDRITPTLDQVRLLAERAGGYVQRMSSGSITVKVPAARFAALTEAVEALGEVTRRQIDAQDVTDQVRDLSIRLDTAEKARQRLIKLLDKAEKVEDAIKIEKELQRIIELIELLKGKLLALKDQVAYSTLTVHVNSQLPQDELEMPVPFQWVDAIGADLAGKPPHTPLPRKRWFHWISWGLPDSYVLYHEREDLTLAMSADGVYLRLQRHENYEGGTLTFWSKLLRRTLVHNRAIALDEGTRIALGSNQSGVVFAGSKPIGRRDYGYMIGVIATGRSVYTVEAWGPGEALEADSGDLTASFRTISVR